MILRDMNMKLPIKRFQCGICLYIIEVPQGAPKPQICPRCGAPSTMIHRVDKGPPGVRCGGGRGSS